MERLRRVTNGTYALTVRTVDDDGAAVTVSTPVVELYDGAGLRVGQDGTPAPAAGSLSYAVPAGVLTELDSYTAVWSGTVAGSPVEYLQQLELVGGYLFEVPDLRTFDPAFQDTTRYPGALIRAARTAAEERFEKACRQAFVPRGRRSTLLGDGTFRAQVSDNACCRLIGGSVAATLLTVEEVAEVVVREWGAFDRPGTKVWPLTQLVQLHYEHGSEDLTPEISQAVMLLAREYLVRSSLSSRATVEATDVGFFRVSVASPDRPTGLPEVDAVIRAVGRNRPLIG
jgi:hypothetical protein